MSRDDAAPAGAQPGPWVWATLATGLVVAIAFDGLARWVGVAAALAVVGDALAWRPFVVARPHLVRWLPALLVVVATFVLLDPLWRGIPPASRDHGIHYYQVHLLVHEVIPRGHFSGWIEAYNNGYPYGESYPVLGYVWCAAPHLLTFGAIDLRESYALGLFSLWVLATFASWRLGACIAREITSSTNAVRFVAAVSALLWLFDPGGSRLGGWSYMMFHGVWAQLLSSALWVLALTEQWTAWRRPSPRRLALATILLGASVLAHPFGMLTAAVSAVAWIGVLTWAPGTSALPGGRLRWWLGMHLGAFAVAAGTLATFFGAAESMRRGPVTWEPLGDLAAGLLRGNLFDETWVWSGPAAVVGAVLLVRRGGAVAWVVLASLAMMIVLASSDSITVLQLDLVVSGFKNLQFPRWALAIKPLMYALAAVGIVATARALAAWSAPRAERAPVGARFVAALLVAPLLAALVAAPSRLVPRPIGGIDTLADAGLQDAERELLRALRTEQAAVGPGMRVAFLRQGMTGAMWPLMALAEARIPIVLDGHVATVNFRHRVSHRKPAVLAALGVTHILWDGHLARDEALAADAQIIGEYGHAKLARLRTPPDRRPVELDGSGTLEISEVAAQRVRFSVRGSARDTRLFLLVPPHPKWHLRRDGEELELEAWGSAFVRSRVVAPGDGDYELRYEDRPAERYGHWLTLATALALLGALAFGTPINVRPRKLSPTARRVLFGSMLLAAIGLAVWVQRRQQRRLAETWAEIGETGRRPRAGPRTFVRDLVVDDGLVVVREPGQACVGVMTKNALIDCVEADEAPRPAMLYEEPYLYRCLRVSVPPRGQVRFWVPGVGPGQVVLGRLSHEGDPRQDLQYAFTGGARPLGRNPPRVELSGEALAAGTELVVRNRHRTPAPICLSAALFDAPGRAFAGLPGRG